MRHKLNKDYFKAIDNEEKAYWLGFIAADGCVYKMSKNAYRLQINLKEDDIDHLKIFNEALESNYKIDTKTVKTFRVCQLKIASKQLTDDLILLGIVPRKSLVVQMPKLDEHLYKHFIRGYFDGDGCVSYTKRKDQPGYRYSFGIVGGETMLEEINKKMGLILSIYNINHSETVNLSTANKDKITFIYHYLYDDANTYLKRKKEKFDFLMSLFAEMQSK